MFVNRIYEWARQCPHKTALIHNDAPLNYAGFARAIEAARRFLATNALPPDRMAIVLADDLRDCWIIVLALHSLGVDSICVKSIADAVELGVIDSGFVVATPVDQRTHDLGYHSLPGVKIVVVSPSLFDGIGTGPLPNELPDERPGGHILYTSGTTGRYKKVLFDNENRVGVVARNKGFDTETCFHAAGFGLWTSGGYSPPRAVWQSGGCVVTDQRPDFLERLFRHPINDLFMLPQDIKDLLALPDPVGAPFAGLKMTTGGGFLPLTTAHEVVRRITGHLVISYAATECFPIMQQRFWTVDDLLWLTPVEGRVVEVVNELGLPCQIGQEGQLRVLLADHDCQSYLDDDEANARMFCDGYFYPGDMAVRRSDGRVQILGRVGDVLNFQGQKIAAAPIEQRLQTHLQVQEVCLFATQARDGSERLVIAIESAAPPPRTELEAVARKFGSFETVRFLVLPEFPRTQSGTRKTDRIALRRLVAHDTVDTKTEFSERSANPSRVIETP